MGSALRALLYLAPKTAHQITDDGPETKVQLEEVVSRNRLGIRHGNAVSFDGLVFESCYSVDESMATGELVPVEKVEGERVTGSTLNKNGSLIMRTDKVGANMVLSQIVEMVAKA